MRKGSFSLHLDLEQVISCLFNKLEAHSKVNS